MSLDIKVFTHGVLAENTYLVTEEESLDQIIIDPGCIGDDVINCINNNHLKYIILTHGHFDHFNSAEEYLNKYPEAVFLAPKNDMYLMSKGTHTEFSLMGIRHNPCPPADEYVVEGDIYKLGEYEINFIETPGHTEGGICVLIGDKLFSGDTLFRLSVGNTSFETGNFNTLVNSIQNKLFTLDDDIVVYPGHGAETTIGYEKRANPFV